MPDLRKRIANLSLEKRALLELRLMQKGLAGDKLESIPRRNTSGPYPSSFAQRPLWFLDHLEPDSSVYNIPFAFRLSGGLKVSALEKSIVEIIRRHESLRTTFSTVNGQPMQVIAESLRFKLPLVNLSRLQEKDRENEIHRLATAEARRPFDLTQGPLFRVALLKINEEDHVLLLAMHHIISDGWSMGVFFKELSSLYSAFSTGNPSPLPEVPIQYADFAVWQQQWLQGEVLETQLSYWKKQLEEASPTLELPADRPRPPIQTYRGARQALMLPKALTEGLKTLSAEEDATLFMTLMAAFQTLLFRYTGQKDIIVGSPIANRNRTEIEGLIGFFVNTLVMRTDFSGEPSFRELLNRVREVALGAYAHQDLPFEKLVEELQPERDLSRSPVIQVMFGLQNIPKRPLELSELEVSPIEQEKDTAMFDLTLFLREVEEGIKGSLEYSSDLFDSARISRMVGHYRTLLEGIISNPDQLISKLPLLTSQEQHRLLVGWNDTQKDYPKDRCIHELFEAQVEQTPDSVAVVFGEETVTYRELNRQANQLAHHLRSLGAAEEVLVGVYMERSTDMVVGLLGILKAGGAYVPLDQSYPKERLSFMLEDSNVWGLLTQRSLLRILPRQKAEVICLDKHWNVIARQGDSNPVTQATSENLAYVIYTSGSTGKPKGVQVSHRALVNFLFSMMREPGLTDQDVLLAVTTLSFDIAMLELLLPLIVGARVVIASREEGSDGHRLLERLTDSGATVMQATPASWRLLLAAGWQGDERLSILCGGEALPRDLAAQLFERSHSLWNMYGPTETTIWSTVNKIENKEGPVLIGFPIANTQIYILDRHLQPVPVGVPGELYIGGDGLATGYLNRPALTAESFIPDPYSNTPGRRMYKTGDLAKYLPDGNVEVLGRLDFQVKVRGFRIELGDVEAALEQHPAVRQAVVAPREDIPGDKRLVAYIVANDKETIPVNVLRNFLKRKLPAYMVPSLFEMIDALPLTPSGKVDRRALHASDGVRRAPVEVLVAPRDELELRLTKTWEKVLNIQPIGVSDNFFELGGHSLIAVRLFAQIEEILGKNLPLATLFQAPTVEQLANILREQGWSAPSSSLEAIEPGGGGSRSISNRIARHIPARSHPYLKQQYHKIRRHSGYLYLKREYLKARSSITKRFLSYRPSQLEKELREIGLTQADTVYMHSAFNAFNGFLGGPQQIIDCILNVIGDSGNLVMVSMPYTGATDDHLKAVKTFDVMKTESSMGIITEIFRRKKDVLRSLNPAHPILAFGPDAKWIISGHEKIMYSCGKASPFEKILELSAKALFFDVPFRTMTFFHFLEDKFKECSPVKLYDAEPIESMVIDSNGNEIGVKTYVFSKEARESRNGRVMEREVRKKNLMKTDRIGNTKLILVNLRDVVGCAQELLNAGMHFYNV